VQKGVRFAIAADVSKDSANKALLNVKNYELEDQIDVRVGDGLRILSDYEADTVIIAGMGGVLITKILAVGVPKGVKRIALQPMRDAYELRQWLAQNGYRIMDESLALESGRQYNIILVEVGEEENTDEFDLFIGAKLIQKKHALLLAYAKLEYNRINKKIDGQTVSNRAVDAKLLIFKQGLEKILEDGGIRL